MGDTTTHRQIALQVIPILKAARPDDEMYYFELGNWMTDLSQFRDPSSMVGAKPFIFESKTNIVTQGLANVVEHFDGYLDELMGMPGKQGGLLAAWFREMCLAATVEKFRKDSTITPERLETLFNQLFTQYYPHEHMDFPPWPRHDIIGERNPSQWSLHQCEQPPTAGSGRELYQYQEEQIVYISDLLTVIEQKWARQPDAPDTADERQVVLTRFGHASHAMEDFFFHSNFVETAWQQTGQPLPFTADDASSDTSDDHEEQGPRDPHREKRRNYRRLRAPVGKGDDLSTDTSNAMEQVYTGYFAGKDMYHTFMDAIKGLKQEASFAAPLLNKMDPEKETDKEKDKQRKDALAEHKKLLFDGVYEAAIKSQVTDKKIHQITCDAVVRACQLDKNLWQKYSGIDLGVSGFVMTLLNLATDEMEKAKAVWSVKDKNAVETDDPTDNGASNENIGSHSLMAKDSVRKHPLRNEAFSVASTIALYVAKRMIASESDTKPVARSVNAAPSASDGGASNTTDVQSIDWLHLLQHFIAHPKEAEQVDSAPWWQAQLAKTDPDETGHTLRFIDAGTVAQRLQETKKAELEKKYDDLAVDAEKEWQKDKGKATGTFIGQVIGAVAGAVAGAIIGAKLGGVGGAILGGIIGAVAGFLIGGLVGGLLGGLLS